MLLRVLAVLVCQRGMESHQAGGPRGQYQATGHSASFFLPSHLPLKRAISASQAVCSLGNCSINPRPRPPKEKKGLDATDLISRRTQYIWCVRVVPPPPPPPPTSPYR